jgi:hypothetical protein
MPDISGIEILDLISESYFVLPPTIYILFHKPIISPKMKKYLLWSLLITWLISMVACQDVGQVTPTSQESEKVLNNSDGYQPIEVAQQNHSESENPFNEYFKIKGCLLAHVQDDESYTETAEFTTYMNALRSILVEISEKHDFEEKSDDEIVSIFENEYDRYLALEEDVYCATLISALEGIDPPSTNRLECDLLLIACLAGGGSDDFCRLVRDACNAYNPNIPPYPY